MSETSKQDQVLQEVISTCKSTRSRTRRPRYADKVKQQIVGLFRSGVSVRKLSQATGVTQGAISRWTGTVDRDVTPVRILSVEKSVTPASGRQVPALSIKVGTIDIIVFALGDRP